MDMKSKLFDQVGETAWTINHVDIMQNVDTRISNTFLWMWSVLLLAFGSWFLINMYDIQIGAGLYYWSALGWLAIVFIMSFLWTKMSYTLLAWLFLLFGLLEWVGLWMIFSIYQWGSITNAFLTTSLMFFLLAFAWYVMKVDVTKIGNILFVWLIALIIWFLINIFWMNKEFNIWLSVIWIIIFCGFIIYDMWMLKETALIPDNRLEIIIALWFFLNFINIFFLLLNLMWSRE